MVWVVDGTRLQRDYPRFKNKFNEFKSKAQKGVYFVEFIDEVFPKNWLKSSVPVIFNFQGLSLDESDQFKTPLWCLLPQTDSFSCLIVCLRKTDFINKVYSQGQLFNITTKQNETEPKPKQHSQIKLIKTAPFHNLARPIKRRRRF